MIEPDVLAGYRIELREGEYLACLIDGTVPDGMTAYQRLRYDYFVRQRGWVAGSQGQLRCERDRYDGSSRHLGVFHDGRLLAYLRALPWQGGVGFMLDHEFRCLLPDSPPPEFTGSLEVSRLVLSPELTGDLAVQVTELLFKLLYLLTLELGKDSLYIVVEAGWIRRFRHCFRLPFRPLGPSQRFPDGTRTVAAHASLRELERSMQTSAPDKLRWYQESHT